MKPILFLPLLSSCVLLSCVDSKRSTSGPVEDEVVAVESIADTADTSMDITQAWESADKSNWEYDQTVDEMTDKTAYFASTTSENSVDFDFPYEGGSRLTFTIRDSPQYGKDMYIRISKGQFNSSFDGTKIKIRFDDSEAFNVSCNEPSDYSSDVLFLTNYNKLLKLLKTAKTMKINVEFFNEGTRTFTFNVEGLDWNH